MDDSKKNSSNSDVKIRLWDEIPQSILSSYSWSGEFSDENVTSGTSTASWTDDIESDVSQYLKEQIEKFDNSCYGDRSSRGLAKISLKESYLWSHHSPHLRVLGKSMKIEPVESDEVYDSNYEEVFALEGYDETVNAELNSENILNKKNHSGSLECSNLKDSSMETKFEEDLKRELIQKLFEKVWPKVLQKIEPTIKTFFKQKENLITLALKGPDDKSTASTITGGSSTSSIVSSHEEISKLSVEEKVANKQNLSLASPHWPLKKQSSMNSYCANKNLAVTVVNISHPPSPSLSVTMQKKEPKKPRSLYAFSAQPVRRNASTSSFGSFNINNQESIGRKPRNGLLPPIETIDLSPKMKLRSTSAFLHSSKSLKNSKKNSHQDKIKFPFSNDNENWKKTHPNQKQPKDIQYLRQMEDTNFHEKAKEN